MTYIFKIIFCVALMHVFFIVFAISFATTYRKTDGSRLLCFILQKNELSHVLLLVM